MLAAFSQARASRRSSSRNRFVALQRRLHGKWVKVIDVPLEGRRYEIHVAEAGVYRVLAGWAPGPVLRVAPSS